MRRKLLGEILKEAGLIKPEELEEALQVQQQTGERLGKVLVKLGYVTEQQINEVLEFQLGIPQVALHRYHLDPQLVTSLPEQLVRRHKVIALKKNQNRLTVAMVDPLNVVAIDDLRLATGCEIEPVIATEEEVDAAIKRYFGLGDDVGRVLKNFVAAEDARPVEVYALNSAEGLDDEAPIVRAVNTIIQQAISEKVSDIHLEAHEGKVRVRYRSDGVLRDVMDLPRQTHASLISRLKIMARMDISEKRLPQDGRIQVRVGNRTVDLRVSSIPTVFGEKIAIRILDKSNLLLKLNQLGFEQSNLQKFNRLIKQSYGMILLTGPTGSGKTTTLYAALSEINSPEKNIITIEDPVEYILPGINQIQVLPKVGLDFAAGLRSILRQDPDVIMVGEIRDSETAEIAVRAATTGHLVFSTLHTNDVAGAVTRLLDMGIEPFLVASSLTGVVAQRLVRMICPQCRTPYELPPDAPERVFVNLPTDKPVTLYRGRGCGYCNQTGYRGRMAIHEVLVLGSRERQLIIEKAPTETIREAAVSRGMVTLWDDGFKKAMDGLTTLQEVIRVASGEFN